MVEEIKVEGMEQLTEALTAMKGKIDSGSVPEVTSSDNGKVLKASYSEGEGSASWGDIPAEVPAVTSSDNGKVLKATYSEGAGSYGWGSIESGSNYDFYNDRATHIGNFNTVSGQTVSAKPILTMEVDISGNLYPGNGNVNVDIASLPNNAIILDAVIYGSASGNIVCVKPTYMIHNPDTAPANSSWNIFVGANASFDTISMSKLFVTYIDMTEV